VHTGALAIFCSHYLYLLSLSPGKPILANIQRNKAVFSFSQQIAEVSLLPGYDATSLVKRFTTF
jgi:hypothetical protein